MKSMLYDSGSIIIEFYVKSYVENNYQMCFYEVYENLIFDAIYRRF